MRVLKTLLLIVAILAFIAVGLKIAAPNVVLSWFWLFCVVIAVASFLGILLIRMHYLDHHLSVERLLDLSAQQSTPQQLTVDQRLRVARTFERGRTLHTIVDAILLVFFVGAITFMIGDSKFFTSYVQNQIVNAVGSVIKDPGIIEGHQEAIRRGAVIASASVVRGSESVDLYDFLEANVFPVFDKPTRRNMQMDYHFSAMPGYKDFLAFKAIYDWEEGISKELSHDHNEELTVQYFRIKTAKPVGQEQESTLTIDNKPVLLTWTRGNERRRGELVEESFQSNVTFLIRREHSSRVVFVRPDRIPINDYHAYTALRAMKGFRLTVTWTQETHMKNFELWVFTVTAKWKRQNPLQCETGFCRWEYEDWLLPGCGYLLTWQTPPGKERDQD